MASELGGAGGIGSTIGGSIQSQQTFHYRCGRCITLLNFRTATRTVCDFSQALVFSGQPLVDDVLFEVVIEKKNNSWGGGLEIGVTMESPDELEMVASATAMRNGTWIYSGMDIRKDGRKIIEFYGTDLEALNEKDRVGVMRTSNHELIFYVNGIPLGVAASNMPSPLWALVDLYGKCVQVSLCPTEPPIRESESPSSSFHGLLHQTLLGETTLDSGLEINTTGGQSSSTALNGSGLYIPNLSMTNNVDFYDMNDRLRFHTRCGSLVKLSTNFRSAERRRPLDEFNNGVVMTHRPLRDNELFEIRIDKLVDKWSGSIEVGVTSHNPSLLHFPATMTNMRSGTTMMSGCGILTNGKGTRRQYGEFNLDELREGDRVGMMRKSNNNLHYYINGQDQGIAAFRVAPTLWGVIDLYGMTIKVTIVDRDERERQNLVTRRNAILAGLSTPTVSLVSPDCDVNSSGGAGGGASVGSNGIAAGTIEDIENSTTPAATSRNDDRLTFHPICGSHATVTQSGRTALRPNASDDFNNGVVLTRRPLRPNELFQVRLERVITKWAGSVELGVTTHSAEKLDFPFTMTNVRSGTWMMTGNGVMQNGVTVIEQYGQNLDRLQVGDRVGVVRKDDGTLHFWVNGVDQGPAATNVPEKVYGVIDLYGQAAQASIVDTSELGSPDTGNSTISNTTLYSEIPLRFHSIHGANAGISNSGLTASRPNSLAEFNDAIVFSNRPLRNRELFEVELENMVSHWSGNIEIGVTSTRPEDIQLAPNATDLEANDTIILCGPMIFHNRKTIRTNVLTDLDALGAGTRVGVMRNNDYIHFFVDGIDQGSVCECRSTNIWAIIDLYGQCAQVSITSQIYNRAPYATSENSQSCQATSVIQQPAALETKHRWTCIAGNVTLSEDWTMASRLTGGSAALSSALVFSEHPLSVGSPFEIKITSHNPLFAGCLSIGVTDLNLSDESVRKKLPLNIKRIPANVWYVSGNEVRFNSSFLHRSLASLEWLRVDDRISIELTAVGTIRILLNSEDLNIKFFNLPSEVYVVAELQGSTMAVQVTSSQGPTSPLRPTQLRLQDSLDFGVDPLNKQDSMLESIDSEAQNFEFTEAFGKNVRLSDDRRSATRFKSYNQALICLSKPLCRGETVSVKIDAINTKWKGTIGVGVCAQQSHGSHLVSSILNIKRPCWAVTHEFVNINGQVMPSKYGDALDEIQVGSVVTISLTHAGQLIIMIGATSLDDLATGLPNNVYPVFDVYGKCEKITLITPSEAARNGTPIIEAPETLEMDSLPQQGEKANLEMYEKEKDVDPTRDFNGPSCSNSINRSVMESVSENLLLNISIKNRSLEQNRVEPSTPSTTCCLRESLQLQHNTNLNIQRSQSTQRFHAGMMGQNASHSGALLASGGIYDTNKENDETNIDYNDDEHNEHMITHNNNDENNLAVQLMHASGGGGSCVGGISASSNANSLGGDDDNDNEDDNDNGECEDDQQSDGNMNNLFLLQQLQQIDRIQHNLLQTQMLDLSSMNLNDSGLSSAHANGGLESGLLAEPNRCEYLKLVLRFWMSLVLPQAFFPRRFEPLCFCSDCSGDCDDKLNGWVYFKLNQQTVNSSTTAATTSQACLDFSGDWISFYYITRVDKIRAILDRGQPLPLETSEDSLSLNSMQKDEPGTRLELFYSPNAKTIEPTIPEHHYVCESGVYRIVTAFEVYVRRQSICGVINKTNFDNEKPNCREDNLMSSHNPSMNNCFSTSAQSSTSDNVGYEEPSCSNSSGSGGVRNNMNDTRATNALKASSHIFKDMGWFTKEAGACVINALILKLEKVNIDSHSPSSNLSN